MSRRLDRDKYGKPCPEYERLPMSIKDVYSYKEWLWLSRTEKDNLITLETEPEVE